MARRKDQGRHHSPDPSLPARHDHYDHYESTHPSKRCRTGNLISGRTERYDPYSDTAKYNSYKPPKKTSTHTHTSNPSTKPSTNIHTRHDRKHNRSTRIHSIRNLLARGDLPPNLKIEKERELASLLFDQQKDKVAKDTKQMIQRYHKVRFFERKKAQRRLRKLIKERDAWINADETGTGKGTGTGLQGDPSGEDERVKSEKDRQGWLKQLDAQIREARVDLNYALYSPLSEKYISLFAGHEPEDLKKSVEEPKIFPMKKRDQALLTTQRKEELDAPQEEKVEIIRLSDKSVKPPMWFEVEKIMHPSPSNSKSRSKGDDAMEVENSEEAVKKKLEMLREGRLTTNNHNGPRDTELVRGQTRATAQGGGGAVLNGRRKCEVDVEPSVRWEDETRVDG